MCVNLVNDDRKTADKIHNTKRFRSLVSNVCRYLTTNIVAVILQSRLSTAGDSA